MPSYLAAVAVSLLLGRLVAPGSRHLYWVACILAGVVGVQYPEAMWYAPVLAYPVLVLDVILVRRAFNE